MKFQMIQGESIIGIDIGTSYSSISIMKNDTIHFWDILTYFEQSISIKTKNNLFNSIKQNKSEFRRRVSVHKEFHTENE